MEKCVISPDCKHQPHFYCNKKSIMLPYHCFLSTATAKRRTDVFGPFLKKNRINYFINYASFDFYVCTPEYTCVVLIYYYPSLTLPLFFKLCCAGNHISHNSSMATYSVEFSKSSRASCKKCKNKIEKDSLRIGTHTMMDDISMTSWIHLNCFKLPKKFSSIQEFIDTLDMSDLPETERLVVRNTLAENQDVRTPSAKRPAPSAVGRSAEKKFKSVWNKNMKT